MTDSDTFDRLKELVADAPDLPTTFNDPKTLRWLAEVHTLVERVDGLDAAEIKTRQNFLDMPLTGGSSATALMGSASRDCQTGSEGTKENPHRVRPGCRV